MVTPGTNSGERKIFSLSIYLIIKVIIEHNTPGTRCSPGSHYRTLAVKRRKSYLKILGETNFQPREFPRSGSKAKDGEKRKREREKERLMVITMAKGLFKYYISSFSEILTPLPPPCKQVSGHFDPPSPANSLM